MYPGAIAAERPDATAYVMSGSGQVVTYGELHDRAVRLANVFRSHGLTAGDHVAFSMENHPLFLAVAWGAQYAGLYYTAVSSRLTADETAYIVNDCGAEAYVTSAARGEVARAIVEDTPAVTLRLCVDGSTAGHDSYEDALAGASDRLPDDATEGMDMLYSSGTTGRPKGVKVPRSGEPLGTPPVLYHLCTGLFGATEDSVYLSPAPLYHSAPLRFTMSFQRAGATIVVMERFDPETALAAIETYGVTFTQMVPTMFVRLLKLPDEVRSRYDVSSLEAVAHAAAPCPIDVKRSMIEWWGPIITEYYAGTEGNGFCFCTSDEWLAHPGTVGKSLLGPVHIVGDDGEEVPVGETGTVYFESAAPFAYHNDEEKTAASYHREGWSTLGDVGHLDDDDYLYLTDRKAYMIISGGVNIYPQEAENCLTMHPAVADVAVFGVPDDDLGESVKAVVQPSEGAVPGPDLEADLIAHCREHLAHVKCPRSVDFRDELPRHPTGKLYKRLLKDEYWAAAGRRI